MTNRIKWSWFDTSNESFDIWGSICPRDEWRILPPTSLPDIIPWALRAKCNNIFTAGSHCGDGTTYFMANCMRVDPGGTAIDQEPFGLAFVGSVSTGSGYLIHHGAWVNRTIAPPPGFWEQVKLSGIGKYYPFSVLPNGTQGRLSDLNISSQIDAFNTVIDIIRRDSG